MNTKVCIKCKTLKSFSEFNKKKNARDGHQGKCKSCAKKYRADNREKTKAQKAEYYLDNLEKIKDYQAEYRAANPEKVKEYQARYRTSNPEKIKAKSTKYYADNLEKIKDHQAKYYLANFEERKEYSTKYRVANPEKGRAWCSTRRAAKLKAIPKWLTEEDWQAIEAINEEADRLTKETGIKHEVDHIHPLRGKLVCGLHCPTNLQILTKSQNCSKSNRFTPYVESA